MNAKGSKLKNFFANSSRSPVGKRLETGDMGQDFVGKTKRMDSFSFYEETEGKIKVILSVTSVDTAYGASQISRLDEIASATCDSIFVLAITSDLPFAISRFCSADEIQRIPVVSDFSHMDFGNSYGFVSGESGLLSNGLVVLNRSNEVAFVQYIKNPDISPDFEHALAAAEKIMYDETLSEVDKLLHG